MARPPALPLPVELSAPAPLRFVQMSEVETAYHDLRGRYNPVTQMSLEVVDKPLPEILDSKTKCACLCGTFIVLGSLEVDQCGDD